MTTTLTENRLASAHRWIVGRDTGTSSITIWSCMMGVKAERVDVPYDPDDFGRCWRLLAIFPEWRERLAEVAAKHPSWTALVRDWRTLERLYEDIIRHDEWWDRDAAKRLYDAMQPLIDEGRIADGWERTGPGSWRKGKSQ